MKMRKFVVAVLCSAAVFLSGNHASAGSFDPSKQSCDTDKVYFVEMGEQVYYFKKDNYPNSIQTFEGAIRDNDPAKICETSAESPLYANIIIIPQEAVIEGQSVASLKYTVSLQRLPEMMRGANTYSKILKQLESEGKGLDDLETIDGFYKYSMTSHGQESVYYIASDDSMKFDTSPLILQQCQDGLTNCNGSIYLDNDMTVTISWKTSSNGIVNIDQMAWPSLFTQTRQLLETITYP